MKKFREGEYVRISPNLEQIYPNRWLVRSMLKYAGMIVKVNTILTNYTSSADGVYLDIEQSGFVWHPAVLENIGSELMDGDKL